MTVWTGTQRPFGVRGEVAQALGVPEGRVHVIVLDTGGGFGGAQRRGGRGGRTGWPGRRAGRSSGSGPAREEFTWAYFRPAGVIETKASARQDGTLTAWEFHNYNSGDPASRTPDEVENQTGRVPWVEVAAPAGVLSRPGLHGQPLRAWSRSADELARGLKLDPLAFRLLNPEGRAAEGGLQGGRRAVRLRAGAVEPGHGVGIAVGDGEGGYAGTRAEVVVDRSSGRIQVIRLVTAFECARRQSPPTT